LYTSQSLQPKVALFMLCALAENGRSANTNPIRKIRICFPFWSIEKAERLA
jgi:hypothetical protein